VVRCSPQQHTPCLKVANNSDSLLSYLKLHNGLRRTKVNIHTVVSISKYRLYELSHHGLFPGPSPKFVNLVTPYCEKLGFIILPRHLHIIIAFALIYQGIFLLSPYISSNFKSYISLRRRSQINWDIHVVSMVQSLLICWCAFLALGDPQLRSDRVFGYSAFGADVAAMACGYFVWDSYVSLKYVKSFGVGFALHGLASLAVFSFGFV
jgi:hypothetical protein